MLWTKLAIKNCFKFPPQVTSVSPLLGETRKPQITSFRKKVSHVQHANFWPLGPYVTDKISNQKFL